MAEKKIFTSLAFQSGANLIAPKVEARTPLATLTDPTDNNYYTGSAGQLAYNGGNIWVNNDSIWTKLLNHKTTATISGGFTFDRVDENDAGIAPFIIGSSSQHKFVAGLQAETLGTNSATLADGTHGISDTATQHGIPVYGAGGVLPVATPTADGHAANKGYVDTAVQGLDHKESVKFTTTGNIGLSGTSQGNVDSGGNHVAGDRILVKDQDDPSENGIYIAASGAWSRASDDPSTEGDELITNGTFAGGSSTGWSGNDDTTLTVTNDQLVITSGGSDYGTALFAINLTEGKKYIFKYDVVAASNNNYHRVGTSTSSNANPNTSIFANPSGVSNGSTLVKVFTADSTQAASGSYLTIGARNDITSLTIDNVSLKEISEGAFVFVEEGSTKANTSYVFSDPSKYTSHPASTDPAWTQFSGAGQISVDNVTAATSPAHTTPLFKQADTIKFGYNSSHFAVDTNGNLKLASGGSGTGISSALLQDDAVTAAKLDDDGAFLMGRLGIGAGNSSGGALGIQHGAANQVNITHDGASTNEWGLLLGHGNGTAVGSYHGLDNAAVINVVNAPLHLGTNNAAIMTLASGKVLVGRTDTPSSVTPSGTLHVSTARYGSAMLTGDSSDFSVSDETASTSVKYGWASYGSNKTGVTNEQLVITYVNHDQGAFRYFKSGSSYALTSNLTVGKSYKVSVKLKYSGSGTAPQVRMNTDGTGSGWLSSFGTLTTSLATYTETFVAGDQTDAFLSFTGFSSGQTITVDDLEIYEDFLSNDGTLSVNAAADDLVIANSHDAGISIITPIDKKGSIFFGDKGDNDRGAIRYTHNVSGTLAEDERMEFFVHGDSTPALTLHSDRSAKFSSGLGVGTVESTAGTITAKADGGRIKLESNDFIIAALSRQGTSGSALDQGSLALYNAGNPKIELLSNGTSYFNGGNVVVGGTTAYSGTNVTSLTVDATSYPALALKIGGTTTAIVHGNSTTLNIDSSGDRNLILRTNDVDRLSFDGSGIQNHHANPIVNSASIAGLQDGACYDFDGSDDWIDAGSGSGIDDLDKITISVWVKFESWGESNAGRIVSKTSTSNTAGWTLYANNAGRIGLIDDWTTTDGQYLTVGPVVQLNKWYHLAVSYDRSTAAQVPTFYVNGTVATYDSGNSQNSAGSAVSDAGSPLLVGARRINSTSVDREFDGQIRDFKIFPSELDAADVRKLYSGENPKKNLNVELVSNGTFDSNTTGWSSSATSGSAPSISSSSGKLLVVNNSGGSDPYAGFAATTVVGKYYRIAAYLQYSNASLKLTVGSSSGGSQNVNGTQVNSGTADQEYIFKATATTTYINLFALTSSAGANALFDNVSLKEVGTLVDFTPQSASSTQWRNEAIPSLYNGTVNNATLSQGNSYWNNIKQDGKVVTLNGHYDSNSHASYKVGIKNNDPQETLHIGDESANKHGTVRIAGYNSNEYWNIEPGTSTLNFKDWDGTSQLSLNGSSDSVKVVGKLGVGADADANAHLYVLGRGIIKNGQTNITSTPFSTAILKLWPSATTNTNGATSITLGTSTVANYGYMISGRRRGNDGSAALVFSRHHGSDTPTNDNVLVLDESGNLAIGQATAGSKLDVYHSANNSGPTTVLKLGAHSDAVGDGPYMDFHIRWSGNYPNWVGGRIGSVYEQESAGSNRTALVFHTNDDNDAGQGTSGCSEKFRIRGDGTQDHKGNRIVNSQTVSDSWRSSESSLRFDPNSYVLVNNSNQTWHGAEFTYSVWVKTTHDSYQVPIELKHNAGTLSTSHTQIAIQANGTVYTYLNSPSGNWQANSTTQTVNDGKWHNIVWSHKYGTSNNKIYVDGVELSTATTATTVDIAQVYRRLYIGINRNDSDNGFNSGFKGEIKDVRIHNHAMEADEVKGLYNGEATPFAYADSAGDVTPSTANSDASVWTKNQFWDGSAWVTDATLTFDTDHMEVANNNAAYGVYLTPANMGITATVGKRYRISAKFKNGTASGVSVRLQAYPLTGAGLVDHTTTSSYVEVSTEFTATAAFTQVGVWPLSDLNNSNIEFKDFKFEEVGEVAAYTPKSIDAKHSSSSVWKWIDVTGNGSHGSISGATVVGNNDHRGLLRVYGNSIMAPTYGTLDYNGTLQLGNTNNWCGRVEYNASGGTELRLDNSYNSASAKTTFGMKASAANTRLPVMELLGDGSVKATSASSGNLKQVARGFTTTIVQPSGKAFTSFRLNHALGTQFIHVSVIESGGTQEVVECAVRIGSWTEGQTGANISSAGTAVTGVTTMGTENTNAANKEEYCMVTFAAAPAVGTNYKVVVMGI